MAVDNNAVSDGQFTSAMAVDNNTVGMTSSDGQFISPMAVDNNTVGMTPSDGQLGMTSSEGQFTSATAVFISAPHRLSEADLRLDAPLCGRWLSR